MAEHPPSNGREEKGSADAVPVLNQKQQDKILAAFFSEDAWSVFSNKDFTLSPQEREEFFERILDPKERRRMLKVMSEYIDEKFTGANVERKKAEYQQQLILLAEEGLRRQKETEGASEASEPPKLEAQPDERRQNKLLTALLSPDEKVADILRSGGVPLLSPEDRTEALALLQTIEGQERAQGMCVVTGKSAPEYNAQLELLKKEAQAALASTPEQTPEPEPVPPPPPTGDEMTRAVRDQLVANGVAPPTSLEAAFANPRPLNGKSKKRSREQPTSAPTPEAGTKTEAKPVEPVDSPAVYSKSAEDAYRELANITRKAGVDPEDLGAAVWADANARLKEVEDAAQLRVAATDAEEIKKLDEQIRQSTAALVGKKMREKIAAAAEQAKAEKSATAPVEAKPALEASPEIQLVPGMIRRKRGQEIEPVTAVEPPLGEATSSSGTGEVPEKQPKGVSMSDLTAGYNPKRSQEDLYKRYTKLQQERMAAESIEPLSTTPDGTTDWRNRWKGRLRGFIEGAREKVSTMSERGERYGKYLANRTKEIDAELAPKAEKLAVNIGEWYNKLGLKYKILVGAGLTVGLGVTMSLSTVATVVFGGAIATQRALGMMGTFVNMQKHLEKTKEGKSLLGKQEWYRKLVAERPGLDQNNMAALMALSYTFGMSAAIGKIASEISETEWAHRAQEWLKQHNPFGGVVAPTAGAISESRPISVDPNQRIFGSDAHEWAAEVDAEHAEAVAAAFPSWEGPLEAPVAAPPPAEAPPPASIGFSTDDALTQQQHAAAAPPAETAVAPPPTAPVEASAVVPSWEGPLEASAATGVPAEIPAGQESFSDDYDVATPTMPEISVEATRGKGAEWMMKRLVEQLQEKGVTADQYPEGSAMRELLDADKKSINDVIHRMATEQGLFKKDSGESILIKLGDKLSFKEDGSLSFTNAGGEELTASARTFTPPYNVGTPASAELPPLEREAMSPPRPPLETLNDKTILLDDYGRPIPATNVYTPSYSYEEASAVAEQAAAAVAPPPAPEGSVLRTSDGSVVRTTEGTPVQIGTPEQLSGTNELASRLETIQSPAEIRSTLDEILNIGGISKDTVEAAVKAAPRMNVDPSLVKLIEPDTGKIPGPLVFLGKDGGLTVFGAAPTGDTYEVQRGVAKTFAARFGQAVRVLLPGGEPGYELVQPNGTVTEVKPGVLNYFTYKPLLPVDQSVYAFPR